MVGPNHTRAAHTRLRGFGDPWVFCSALIPTDIGGLSFDVRGVEARRHSSRALPGCHRRCLPILHSASGRRRAQLSILSSIREHQYATPYFAYAVATLASAGRAADLPPYGIRAMEHATDCFAGGRNAIPDQHGEFFIASLTGALKLYEPYVPRDRWLVWRQRMQKPCSQVIRGGLNNWQTYAMKGEWMRVNDGSGPLRRGHGNH